MQLGWLWICAMQTYYKMHYVFYLFLLWCKKSKSDQFNFARRILYKFDFARRILYKFDFADFCFIVNELCSL